MAAYSIRAKANAPVSTPIDWNELECDVRFAHFHAGNVTKRVAKAKTDPWANMSPASQSLTKALMARVGFKPR